MTGASTNVPSSSATARPIPGSSPDPIGGVTQRPSIRTATFAIVDSVTSPRSFTRTTSSASGWRRRASSYRSRREVLWNRNTSRGSCGTSSSATRTTSRSLGERRAHHPRCSVLREGEPDPARRGRRGRRRPSPPPHAPRSRRTGNRSSRPTPTGAEVPVQVTRAIRGVVTHGLQELEAGTTRGQDAGLRDRLLVFGLGVGVPRDATADAVLGRSAVGVDGHGADGDVEASARVPGSIRREEPTAPQ